MGSLCRLTEIGAGQVIFELRKKIQKLNFELKILEKSSSDIPELIKSANLLRSNEFLVEINQKRFDLVSAYEQYSKELETMLEKVFEIQKDLKEILKAQTSLIAEQKIKKENKKKKKPSKK